MATHLLDTNILSDILRYGQNSIVSKRIAAMPADSCCTSSIVAAELFYGAHKKGSTRLKEDIGALLNLLPVIPFTTTESINYGSIRAGLERMGTPIGPNDLLIGAQAFSNGLVMVTANLDEFRRVPDLVVENWLA